MAKPMLSITSIAALAAPFSASAHGGHGASQPGDTVVHYLTEPEHIVVTLVCVGLAGLAFAVAERLRSPRSARQHRR